MSTYDKASLVLIPSGTKESLVFSQKPTNGDGDFTFSRSTSATRVGPSGYIEKETQNLLLQSNSFNTTWTQSNVTLTSGQSGYDGLNDAWLLSKSFQFARLEQPYTFSGLYAFSVYAKANTLNWIAIGTTASIINSGCYFDLQNGVVGSSGNSVINKSIQSMGNGWYRCVAIIHNPTESYFRIYPADGNGDVSGASGSIYIQDAQLEQGLVARDYIETTTSAVYGGITDNIPRLDYNGSCPSLLLEPQRTNLVTYSEQFDNAYWTKYAGATVTANTLTSPDGYTNADTLNTTSGQEIYANMGSKAASAITYTFSCFAKYNNAAIFKIVASDFTTSSTSGTFNLQTGEATLSQGATWSDTSVKMENYGNGWYRCIMTTTSPTTTGLYASLLSTNGSVYIYGMQCEQSAYATSYIPTYGTSVTFANDACYKTGVSSLIGQTEGTLFAEVSVDTDSVSSFLNRVIVVTDGTLSNRVLIVLNTDETFRFIIIGGGSTLANITTSASVLNGFHKVALAYKANDYVAYVDGVQVGSNTTASSVPSSLSQAFLGSVEAGATSSVLEGSVKQSLLFKTRLTNEELATLTTI